MKTFMEEYGLASVMAACVMFLVVMASPVGGAINGNLKSTATNMGDTGTNVQANAAKSIKSLAGEEEEVPDTIFVGYNSQNQCLVFSHSEDSSGYNGCDVKYGDINENYHFTSPVSPANSATNPAPYDGVRQSVRSVNIENNIKPKDMSYWFMQMSNIESLNLSNIDTSSCENMTNTFVNCKNLSHITYGDKFVKPQNESSIFMNYSPSSSLEFMAQIKNVPTANRPNWYKDDAVIEIDTSSTMTNITIECAGYKHIAINLEAGFQQGPNWFFYDDEGNQIGNYISGKNANIPTGAKTVKLAGYKPNSTTMRIGLLNKSF